MNYKKKNGSLLTETHIKVRQENVLAKTRKLNKSGRRYVENVWTIQFCDDINNYSLYLLLLLDNREKPCQPNLDLHLATKFRDKDRHFDKTWYDDYKWLEYCAENACFCFPCRVYMPKSAEEVFTEIGFRNWKKAKGGSEKIKKTGLDLHADCKSHKDAMVLLSQERQ